MEGAVLPECPVDDGEEHIDRNRLGRPGGLESRAASDRRSAARAKVRRSFSNRTRSFLIPVSSERVGTFHHPEMTATEMKLIQSVLRCISVVSRWRMEKASCSGPNARGPQIGAN